MMMTSEAPTSGRLPTFLFSTVAVVCHPAAPMEGQQFRPVCALLFCGQRQQRKKKRQPGGSSTIFSLHNDEVHGGTASAAVRALQ